MTCLDDSSDMKVGNVPIHTNIESNNSKETESIKLSRRSLTQASRI